MMPAVPADRLIRIPIGLPAETHEWLRTEAFRRRCHMADLVREALEEYRHRREPQLGLPLGQGEE